MAAALLDHQAAGRVCVTSAGSQPADQLNPAVVQAMAEIGLDLSHEYPKPLTADKVQAADVVITMGCGDACPVYPGKRYLDWDLPDPAGLALEPVRPIRDDIATASSNCLPSWCLRPADLADLSYALRACHVGCSRGSKPAPASGSQIAADGGRLAIKWWFGDVSWGHARNAQARSRRAVVLVRRPSSLSD